MEYDQDDDWYEVTDYAGQQVRYYAFQFWEFEVNFQIPDAACQVSWTEKYKNCQENANFFGEESFVCLGMRYLVSLFL